MRIKALAGVAVLVAGLAAAGCANDGSLDGVLTTSSVTPAKETAKVDPQCVALMSKIDGLRKEGTPERIEKVASGKSETAVVKRASLARMTELEKANAEFQSRCSTLTPAQRAAAATAPVPAKTSEAAAAGAKQAAVKTVSKETTKTAAAKTAEKTVEKTVDKAAATATSE